MKSKILEITEGSFALIGLVAIISISVLTVSALNPSAYTQSQQQVAGEQTENNNQGLPIKVTNLVQDANNFTSEFIDSHDGKYQVILNFKNAQTGKNVLNFVKAENLNNFDKKLKVRLEARNIADKFNAYIIDNIDQITLYSDKTSVDRSVTIPQLSERSLNLELDFNDSVNYPFQLVVYLE